MRKKVCWAGFVTLSFLLLPLSGAKPRPASVLHKAGDAEMSPQETEKPKFDYMSSILLRNAKPLGLKDNVPLRRFLDQPSIKWAIRAGRRHILN